MALLNPYLNFRGQAREALEFYQAVLGGELTVSTFGDFQMPGVDDDEKDSIMHGQLTTPAGFTLMGSDVPATHAGRDQQRHDLDQRQRDRRDPRLLRRASPTAARSPCP